MIPNSPPINSATRNARRSNYAPGPDPWVSNLSHAPRLDNSSKSKGQEHAMGASGRGARDRRGCSLEAKGMGAESTSLMVSTAAATGNLLQPNATSQGLG